MGKTLHIILIDITVVIRSFHVYAFSIYLGTNRLELSSEFDIFVIVLFFESRKKSTLHQRKNNNLKFLLECVVTLNTYTFRNHQLIGTKDRHVES